MFLLTNIISDGGMNMIARKDLNFRKKWIQWVLDFIQMDLGSLSRMKRKTLAEEIVFFCDNNFFTIDWKDFEYILSFPPDKRGTLLNRYLNEMETDANGIQKTLKSFIEKITLEPTETPYSYKLPEVFSFLSIEWSFKEDRELYIPSLDKNQGHFIIHSFPQSDTLETGAVLNFSKLIDGLEVHSIKNCKGCGRYFLNLTEREKIYCNSSCASRSIVKRKREELRKNPRKYKIYLEKQRRYMKRRYREKRRMQLGQKVRVGREHGG
jgi:hypothetical protein